MSEEHKKQAETPADQNQVRMPMFYNTVVPVSSRAHADLKFNTTPDFSFARNINVIPIAVEEFAIAQRFYPILFAPTGEGHPMALVGLKEGENRFVNEKGEWRKGTYVPGYVRRYPFILARRDAQSDEFTLGMDDTSSRLSKAEGEPLFNGDKPSDLTNQAVEFCQNYERAAHQTRLFCQVLKEHELLRTGEVQLMVNGKPTKYEGFRMVDEQKLNNLSEEVTAKLVKNGAITAIHAHLFSLAAFQGLFLETFDAAA